jgi:replicative DNA helicase
VATKFKWNKDFRERILALCLKSDWFSRFGTDLIKPEFFELESEQHVSTAIITFYVKYHRPPYYDELMVAVGDDNDENELVVVVFDILEKEDLSYASNTVIQFAQEQAMKIAILESVGDIEKGDLVKPLERVRKAQSVGNDLSDLGLVLKEDFTWVYQEAIADKVQTGIFHLDLMMEGGLGKGELGTVLAATNVGKSQVLINIGCGAATIMSRANVVHITCEMSARKVARRYGARTVFRWMKCEDDPESYIIRFGKSSKLLMPGNIYIKEYPSGVATVEDIDVYLERLLIMGIKADLLIVDYPDEMKHPHIGEYRMNVAETFRGLRRVAQQRNIPVWAATQAGRSALSREIVTIDNISESYEKATVSDCIIAVCQTMAEKEDKILRLYAAKIRDGDSGWMIKCHVHDDSHAILSDSIITITQMIEEKKKRNGM